MDMDMIRKMKIFWVNCWECFEKNWEEFNLIWEELLTFKNFIVKAGSQVVFKGGETFFPLTLCQKYYRFPHELRVFWNTALQMPLYS